MPPVNYQVSEPPAVTAAYQRLLDRAAAGGQLPLVLRATRYLLDELAYDPLRLGEARGFLPNAQLHVRIAFVPPLYVEFTVHDASKQVFVLRVGLRG